MPPESLSTLAVMNPGPSTARNRSIRIRHRFNMAAVLRWIHKSSSLTITGRTGMREAGQLTKAIRPGIHDSAKLPWYTCTQVAGTGAHDTGKAGTPAGRGRARADRRPY